MEKKEIKTSVGIWTLKKPKAGVRNKAMIIAETSSGVREVLFMTTLLPKCVLERPESFDKTVPVADQLDDLDTEDYDLLIAGLSDLIANLSNKDEEDKKKA